VSNGNLSIAVGIVIIACVSFAVSFIGLKFILVWEKYAWFVFFIIFLIIYGMAGPYATEAVSINAGGSAPHGQALSGSVLTLLAIFYGSSASWCSMASDYYVHYPVDVSRVKVFLMTTLGIALPTSFGMIAGACVASAFTTKSAWYAANEKGLGFVVQEILYPHGFADFILVVFVLSGINVNIISLYSAAISCQQFARPFMRIPRFLWSILCFGVILALALAGRHQLLIYLQNFLSLLGYWCSSYFVIVISEHMIFRKVSRNQTMSSLTLFTDFIKGKISNYNLEGWNDPKILPVGLAAATAFLFGVVAFVMGMNESWYIGPLGDLVGPYGGDLANEFTLVVTAVVFIPLRFLELKYIGR
jgi:purine-cytosine permease-like protein